MKRIGKYRGKRVDNGEWVEGYFAETNYPNYRALIITDLSVDTDGSARISDILGWEIWEVNPESVSKVTGLYDKNGKRVFEGNIVKVSLIGGGERISEVGIGECFDTDGETVFGVFGKCDEGNLIIPISEEYVALYEVIGNKWDNPELMEGMK